MSLPLIIDDGVLEIPFPFPEAHILGCQVLQTENSIIISLENGNHYEFGPVIMKSAFDGSIVKAFPLIAPCDGNFARDSSKQPVVIRISDKNCSKQYAFVDIKSEISCLQYIDGFNGHGKEYIIKLIEACEDSSRIFTILEYVDGGDLYEIVANNDRISEIQASAYFQQIVSGLRFLHSIGICHRDISLESILVSSTGHCKITGLDGCIRCSDHPENPIRPLIKQGIFGKQSYMAPEILASPEDGGLCWIRYDRAGLWSLGVVCFVLTVGHAPCGTASAIDARYQLIRRGRLQDLIAAWNVDISPGLLHLLKSMLHPKPAARLNLDEINASHWMLSTKTQTA